MRIAVFSTKSYDRPFLSAAAPHHRLEFFEAALGPRTASLAAGYPVVCVFVHDNVNAPTLEVLAQGGTRLVALRSAGFNNVDLVQAEALGITVVRVPAYSPEAVAEHTVAMILALNRKIHRAYNRVREGNFALDGLLGFNLADCTVGVVGTGRIGAVFGRLMQGFGCRIVAFDPMPDAALGRAGVAYLDLSELFRVADIVSLHCPLTPQTHHLVDAAALASMKDGAMLINTSRGALIDSHAVIAALKRGKLGYLGLDVYEQEEDLFYQDLSNQVIQDDQIMRLVTFPNVLVTAHQAFLTTEAMRQIAATTVANIDCFARGEPCPNVVRPERLAPAEAVKRRA